MDTIFWQLFGLLGAGVGLWSVTNMFYKLILKLPEQTAEKVIEKLREEEKRKQSKSNFDQQNP